MYVYATTRLRLSEAEAYLRITVARVSRRFPVVLAMLADGRLHVSAIARLAAHLRAEDGEAVLARAVHKSKREIEMLIAELAPRPDVSSLVRRLPARPESAITVSGEPLVLDRVQNREFSEGPAPVVDQAAPTEAGPRPAGVAPGVPVAALASPPPSPAVLAPLAPARYRVQFTAGADLHDKIVRAQSLLRHQIPDGDLAAIFDRAMTLLVSELERARFAATSMPRKEASQLTRPPRHAPFRARSGARCGRAMVDSAPSATRAGGGAQRASDSSSTTSCRSGRAATTAWRRSLCCVRRTTAIRPSWTTALPSWLRDGRPLVLRDVARRTMHPAPRRFRHPEKVVFNNGPPAEAPGARCGQQRTPLPDGDRCCP